MPRAVDIASHDGRNSARLGWLATCRLRLVRLVRVLFLPEGRGSVSNDQQQPRFFHLDFCPLLHHLSRVGLETQSPGHPKAFRPSTALSPLAGPRAFGGCRFPYRSETGGGLEHVMSKPDGTDFGPPRSTIVKVLRMVLKEKDSDSFFHNTAA